MTTSSINDGSGSTVPSGRKGRRFAFAIASLALGLGAFVPAIVDLAIAGRLTWSKYAMGAVLVTWLVLAPWFLQRRRRMAMSWLAAAISIPLYLALIQSMLPAAAWLLPIGLPSAAIGLAGIAAIAWLWTGSRRKGWLALALTVLVVGLMSFGEQTLLGAFVDPGAFELLRAITALGVLCIAFVFVMFGLILDRKGRA